MNYATYMIAGDQHPVVCNFFEWNNPEGYDGLFNSAGECACHKEDLEPCGEMTTDCALGFQIPCDCGDHDYHIVPRDMVPATTNPSQLTPTDSK